VGRLKVEMMMEQDEKCGEHTSSQSTLHLSERPENGGDTPGVLGEHAAISQPTARVDTKSKRNADAWQHCRQHGLFVMHWSTDIVGESNQSFKSARSLTSFYFLSFF